MRILKYKLLETDKQYLTLPRGCKILSVQWQQYAGLVLWVADPELGIPETYLQTFLVVGTGNPSHHDISTITFIDTVQTPSGFVWHVFLLDDY